MIAMTIKETAKYYREKNPKTPITETALRRLVKSGDIRSCKVGVKNIITLEAVEEYFSGARTNNDTATMQAASGIRRLPERIF